MELNLVDIGIGLAWLTGAGVGLFVGFISLLAPLALALSIMVAIQTYPEVVALFKVNGSAALPVQIFSLLLLFLITLVMLSLLMRAFRGAIQIGQMEWVDHLLGLVFGMVLATLLASSILWLIDLYGGRELQQLLKRSIFGSPLLLFFQQVLGYFSRLFQPG